MSEQWRSTHLEFSLGYLITLHKFKAVMLFPIVYLASVTGMRLSELLALRWADVDFLNRTVRVYESSHYGVKRRRKSTSRESHQGRQAQGAA